MNQHKNEDRDKFEALELERQVDRARDDIGNVQHLVGVTHRLSRELLKRVKLMETRQATAHERMNTLQKQTEFHEKEQVAGIHSRHEESGVIWSRIRQLEMHQVKAHDHLQELSRLADADAKARARRFGDIEQRIRKIELRIDSFGLAEQTVQPDQAKGAHLADFDALRDEIMDVRQEVSELRIKCQPTAVAGIQPDPPRDSDIRAKWLSHIRLGENPFRAMERTGDAFNLSVAEVKAVLRRSMEL